MKPDNKNMFLAIAVSLAILLGWQFLFPSKPAPTPPPASQTTTNTSTPGGTPGSAPATPGAVPNAGANGVTPGTPVAPPSAAVTRDAALARSPRVKVVAPEVIGSISLKGGTLDDIALVKHRETIDPNSPPVILLSPQGAPDAYFADYGWASANGKTKVPDSETLWTADHDSLTPTQPVTLSWSNGEGLTFRLRYEVDDLFMFSVKQSVENAGTTPVELRTYARAVRFGTPVTQGSYILHEGPIGVLGGSVLDPSYSTIKDKKLDRKPSTGGWIGFTDKYWAVTQIPDPKAAVTGEFSYSNAGGDRYQVDYITDAQTVAPATTLETANRTYAGAKIVKVINNYRDQHSIEKFDQLIDWGWFWFLTKPMFWLLDWFYSLIGNFGLAIMALTVVVKLAFFPLANKSYQAMSKMKKLGPEMKRLRERHADDKQKLNQEMMGLYKKEKVNPAAGCLPILLQIPVFFSLYKVLYITIEMRHQPFFGWIKDLSAPDPLTILTGFGLFHWEIPSMLHFLNIGIWPLIMGVTMFLQQRLNPPPPDPIQARMFQLMPIFFTFLLGSFPAGLVIYWAWNNTLSILQQSFIMKRMGVKIGFGANKA
ncbi:MAG: membrane protein insertase YidC [Rhodospirillales bacterium]